MDDWVSGRSDGWKIGKRTLTTKPQQPNRLFSFGNKKTKLGVSGCFCSFDKKIFRSQTQECVRGEELSPTKTPSSPVGVVKVVKSFQK
jgi:hypothetical protein